YGNFIPEYFAAPNLHPRGQPVSIELPWAPADSLRLPRAAGGGALGSRIYSCGVRSMSCSIAGFNALPPQSLRPCLNVFPQITARAASYGEISDAKSGGRDKKRQSGASRRSKSSPYVLAKPMNPFMLYRKSLHHKIQLENPGIKNSEISRIIGKMWQNEDKEVVGKFKEMSVREKEKYVTKHILIFGYHPDGYRRQTRCHTERSSSSKVGPRRVEAMQNLAAMGPRNMETVPSAAASDGTEALGDTSLQPVLQEMELAADRLQSVLPLIQNCKKRVPQNAHSLIAQ
ncbi:hypothetical protein EV182_006544, partial [Spiromyces aspiralis]